MIAKNKLARAAAALALTGVAGGALAVQVPIQYQDGAGWGVHALPGDVLPPFGIPDANNKLPPYPEGRPPGAMHVRDREHPESTAPGPSFDLAISGAQAALHECERQKRLGSVVVLDQAGDIRVALNMDGTDGSHIFVAARKALTALEFGKPGIEVLADAKRGDPETLRRVRPAMFVQFGGYPLFSGGKVIGAIGYSGGVDDPCAKAGADYINARLPH
jgi:uncharacterized protein GlcG (DUF336 family)